MEGANRSCWRCVTHSASAEYQSIFNAHLNDEMLCSGWPIAVILVRGRFHTGQVAIHWPTGRGRLAPVKSRFLQTARHGSIAAVTS